ncbi:MAG: hypothetical protein ABEJ22_06935 [Haloferacaceae archaeon]
MTRQTPILITVVIVTLVVATFGGSAVAQEGTAPSGTLTAADISVVADGERTVTATYDIRIDDPGTGDQALSAIGGTLWTFPGHDVDGFTATVDGTEVDPIVDRSSRHISLAVPVQDVSEGDSLTVQVQYTVTGPAGQLKAPIWVPEFETSGTDRAIEMTVTLPDGQQAHGATFPKIDGRSNGGNVLSYQLLHVPGFVAVRYGTGTGGLVNLELLSTLAGLTLIFGFFAVWAAWNRGLIGRREKNVA